MTNARRRKRPSRRSLLILATVVLVNTCTSVTLILWGHSRPAATLADGPVSGEEIDSYRALARDGAIPTGTTTPALVHRIAQDRALFALAQQAHLTGTFSSLESVLAQRPTVAETSAPGRTVYGTGAYTASQFYTRTIANLQAATITALTSGSHPLLAVTTADVEAEIRNHPSDWSSDATTYTFATLTVPWMIGNQTGQQILDGIQGNQGDLHNAASSIAGAVTGQQVIPAASLADSGLSPNTQSAIPELQTGQELPPQPVDNHWVLYQLINAQVDPAEALKDYTPQISQQLVQRKFSDLLANHTRSLLSPHHT